MKIDYKKLSYVIASVVITALLSSHFTSLGVEQCYKTLIFPALTPPKYAFPIAWGIIYISLISSFYLSLVNLPHFSSQLRQLFLSQLFLQILWCFTYFSAHKLYLSFFIIFLLDITIIMTMLFMYKNHKTSFYLLLFYTLWVLFASYLNLGFAYYNHNLPNFGYY